MTMQRNAEQLRKAELAQIHIAKVQLAMADDTYRALLKRVAGKESSKDLTWQERKTLLDEFKRLGFKNKPKHQMPKVGADRIPRMQKIEALLAEAKRPWSYLKPIVKNLGRDSIEFCDVSDLGKIITALVKDAERNGRVTS
ncbi:gp16 family protein [Undibacterium sp.]|uniref:gp16 family protein n=1 Tax=Undibacterium sp. TaxID=1914977 RepID=UPI00273150B1|nr:regulatory protein GemA [Undibacterium sp.]MDP1980497.1 regulatory protein GemA [Undibacterium sp.]